MIEVDTNKLQGLGRTNRQPVGRSFITSSSAKTLSNGAFGINVNIKAPRLKVNIDRPAVDFNSSSKVHDIVTGVSSGVGGNAAGGSSDDIFGLGWFKKWYGYDLRVSGGGNNAEAFSGTTSLLKKWYGYDVGLPLDGLVEFTNKVDTERFTFDHNIKADDTLLDKVCGVKRSDILHFKKAEQFVVDVLQDTTQRSIAYMKASEGEKESFLNDDVSSRLVTGIKAILAGVCEVVIKIISLPVFSTLIAMLSVTLPVLGSLLAAALDAVVPIGKKLAEGISEGMGIILSSLKESLLSCVYGNIDIHNQYDAKSANLITSSTGVLWSILSNIVMHVYKIFVSMVGMYKPDIKPATRTPTSVIGWICCMILCIAVIPCLVYDTASWLLLMLSEATIWLMR